MALLIASDVLVQGEVEHELVEQRVIARQKDLRSCYGERSAVASIRVRFEIGSFGRVTSAILSEADTTDEQLLQCVLQVFRSLLFTPPEHGTVIVNYPVQFGAPAHRVKSDRLTPQSIKEVLAENRPRLEQCYSAEVKQKPSLRGAPLTLAFHVGNDGSPVSIEIHSSHGVRAIDRCMQLAALAMRFARPREGEHALVQFPFVLW